MKFPFLLRENVTVNFEHCEFLKNTDSHFKKMKIYSIGFNYSIDTSKFAICLLKMTHEHSSVAYFQII